MKSKILVIDDDLECLESIKRYLDDLNTDADYFQTPDEALLSYEKNPFDYALAFIDHQYKEEGRIKKRGIQVAQELKTLNPMMITCIVSGDSSEDALKNWLSSCVDYYMYKPLKRDEIISFAEYYVNEYEKNCSPFKITKSKQSNSIKKFNPEIIGESESLQECCKKALKLAKSDISILLLGETGTGKELFAKSIYQNSKYATSWYAVNCSSYKQNPQLLEVELFGSEKGAFTGAENKSGIFLAVNGGTVFLDEIHHLSESAQASLLRVLQEKKVRKVGGKQEQSVRFRLIAAGKPNLKELCNEGKFSLDLYYRLKGVELVIPPLRERKKDITPIVMSLLKKNNDNNGTTKQISKRAMEYLEKHDWPGNVRELESLIKQLTICVDAEVITPKDIPDEIKNFSSPLSSSITLLDLDKEHQNKQKALILKTLSECGNNITEATKLLGYGDKRSSLKSRMKSLKIKDLSLNEQSGLLNKLQSLI